MGEKHQCCEQKHKKRTQYLKQNKVRVSVCVFVQKYDDYSFIFSDAILFLPSRIPTNDEEINLVANSIVFHP